MTTWTTFETLDESRTQQGEAFCVDRLGMFQRVENDRTRFIVDRQSNGLWHVGDLEATGDDDSDLTEESIGTMRECVQWIAGRVL